MPEDLEPKVSEPRVSEQRLFDALATITRAFTDGGVPHLGGGDATGHDPMTTDAPGEGEADSATMDAMSPHAREVLGEAALAVAYGAFASRRVDGGAIHTLIAAMGLMAILSGEQPDPPAEIMAISAEDSRVEQEIDRAGDTIDEEFGRDASPEVLAGAMEARILGTAITLAGCTLPEGAAGQAEVRLRAARCLAKLSAGLLALNVAQSMPPGDDATSRQAA